MNRDERVEKIFLDCLFRDEEIVGGKPNRESITLPEPVNV